MSRMSELEMQIQEDIVQGLLSFREIAQLHGVPMHWVDAIAKETADQDAYDAEPQDFLDESDDAYALASAGFGTDEDYGYYGDE